MCGRYSYLITWEHTIWLPQDGIPRMEFEKRFNIAPTQKAPVIRLDSKNEKKACLLRWGLIPSWIKDIKSSPPLINARAETISSKPSFKTAFNFRRCLVPASGYYEWVKSKDTDKKQAYYISSNNDAPLFFAGLWESHSQEGKEAIETFTIITTTANQTLGELHDRMPVILKHENFDFWLSSNSKTDLLLELLKPAEENLLQFYKVSSLVNSPKNESPECILKVEDLIS